LGWRRDFGERGGLGHGVSVDRHHPGRQSSIGRGQKRQALRYYRAAMTGTIRSRQRSSGPEGQARRAGGRRSSVNRWQTEESRIRVLWRLVMLGRVMLAIGQVRALAQPAPAADKTKVAKQYVDAGLAAQGTGDYDTALTMYSKAYQLVPHPLLIFNMAQ